MASKHKYGHILEIRISSRPHQEPLVVKFQGRGNIAILGAMR
jgi:hypothetical protein